MKFRTRALAYASAGAAGLFTTGVFAAPALAAGPDIAVAVAGTTISANAEGKFAGLDLKNVGDAKPAGIELVFDVSKLKQQKVVFAEDACGEPEGGKVYCEIVEEAIPGPGETLDLTFLLERKAGASGEAGELTITVAAEGDANAENDSATVKVGVGASGVDLGVIAEDVRWSFQAVGTEDEGLTDELVKPGGLTAVIGEVLNQGDQVAKGVKVSVTLPKQATFAEVEEGCAYTSDNRTVTCDYEEFTLIPADKDTTDDDRPTSGAAFWFPVKVVEGVEPGSLTGGTFSAFALGAEPYEAGDDVSPLAGEALPRVEPKSAKQIADEADADPSDNSDTYAIVVGAGGGSGGGGELPVTGVQAGLIGGVGLAVLAGGGALLLMARRRRLVLVAPDDETPTA